MLILPIISIFQASQMIKINDDMRILAFNQNAAETYTQKLEKENKDALNSFLKSQNEFTKNQSSHLEEMKQLDRKRFLISEEERKFLKEATKPRLEIIAFADVIPVKFQLDSKEMDIDAFVRSDEADYRVIVSLICLNASTNPIALTDVNFQLQNYISNKNIFLRYSGGEDIPFYFYDDSSFMELKPTKKFPCVLKPHESFDTTFFYECIGKPTVESGVIKIATDAKAAQFDGNFNVDDEGNIFFSSNVELTFHPGLSKMESIYNLMNEFRYMKDEYRKINDDINER